MSTQSDTRQSAPEQSQTRQAIISNNIPSTDELFRVILQESEQESVMAQSQAQSQAQSDTYVDIHTPTPIHDQSVDELGVSQAGRLRAQLSRARKHDQRSLTGKWVKKSPTELCPDDMKSVHMMLRPSEYKPRWAVDACVVLRDQGLCVVCQDPIHKGYQVMQLVPRVRGGLYAESNCVCVCKECAECWFPHRDFGIGLGSRDMLDRLCVHVLERRQRGFHGVKRLSEQAFKRMVELRRVVDDRYKRMVQGIQEYTDQGCVV